MRIAIHQPEYFPWLGFIDKARRVDALVMLDSVQFDRASLQHRAKVIGANGVVWLTIPFVHRFPQRIDAVEIAEPRFALKQWKTLQACYGRAAGWRSAAPKLEALLGASSKSTLMTDVTIPSVRLLLEAFGVATRVVRASELRSEGDKGELVLNLCRELGATSYLSGRSGANYLDAKAFAAAGIELEIQAFTVPTYPRLRDVTAGEQRGISALDAWLNLGDESARALLKELP